MFDTKGSALGEETRENEKVAESISIGSTTTF
jgi:hypothetical protein